MTKRLHPIRPRPWLTEPHPLDQQYPAFNRADGNKRCWWCHQLYFDHDPHPYLKETFKVLCFGRVVKV